MAKKLTRTAKLVRKTGRLLLDPKKRCTGKPAADRTGVEVDTFNIRAEKFCLVGALARTTNDDWGQEYRDVRAAAGKALGAWSLVTAWDETNNAGRTRIAKKLATYVEYE